MALYKKIIVYLGILLLLLHFFLISVYLTDGKFTPEKINSATNWYIRPLFHQSWKIFAPEPPLWNVSLVYRYQFNEGEWSRWKNPAYHWLIKHYSNRFSFYGKKFLIPVRIARGLFDSVQRNFPGVDILSVPLEREDLFEISETKEYKLAEKYLIQLSEEEYPGKIKKIQFAYVAAYPVKFEERKKQNPEKKIKVLRFLEIMVQITDKTQICR